MQKVLKDYGLESKVLRAVDAMTDRSPAGDGLFPFEFDGAPGIRVILERDYWVLATWSAKKDDDTLGYIFNSRDQQSALNISIGESVHERTDDALAKVPGFSIIGHGEGNIAGQPMVWRRWADDAHLYSDCTLRIPTGDGSEAKTYKVNVSVTANTVSRRQALEGCMPSLRLLNSGKSNAAAAQTPVPAPAPATPAPLHP